MRPARNDHSGIVACRGAAFAGDGSGVLQPATKCCRGVPGLQSGAHVVAGAKADAVVIDADPGVNRGRAAAPASHLTVEETLRASDRPAISFDQHIYFQQDLHAPSPETSSIAAARPQAAAFPNFSSRAF